MLDDAQSPPSEPVARACAALQACGLGVLDVGARGGMHPALLECADVLEVVGFEPDARECRRLQAAVAAGPFRSVRYLPIALAERDGERTLYQCRDPGVSSLYPPNRPLLDGFPDAARFDVLETSVVTVRSLDSLLTRDRGLLPDYIGFIKLDTQGSELDILRGAGRVLAQDVVGIEVEVEFLPMYQSQPLFRDVDAFLADHHFALHRLSRFHWVRRSQEHAAARSAGQLAFADALYLREADRVVRPAQLEALVLIALWFDLHDVALEALERPHGVPLAQAEGLRTAILARSRRLARAGGAREAIDLIRAWRMIAKDWRHLKHWFPFMRQYPATWARTDGDLHSRAARAPAPDRTVRPGARQDGILGGAEDAEPVRREAKI
jgi:FkbM family methyltransferase